MILARKSPEEEGSALIPPTKASLLPLSVTSGVLCKGLLQASGLLEDVTLWALGGGLGNP